MAGIDHDQRPRVAAGCGLRMRLRLAGLRQPVVDGEVAHEGLAVERREVEHEAGGLIVGGIDHHGLLHPRRAGKIDDHARAALHDEAETERLDQAAPRLPRAGREPERDLRHVDHHPVGIGEGEGADVDLAAEIDDEAGLAVVAPQAYLARHREVARLPALGHGRAGRLGGGAAENHRAEDKRQARRADRHRYNHPPRGHSYSVYGAVVNPNFPADGESASTDSIGASPSPAIIPPVGPPLAAGTTDQAPQMARIAVAARSGGAGLSNSVMMPEIFAKGLIARRYSRGGRRGAGAGAPKPPLPSPAARPNKGC